MQQLSLWKEGCYRRQRQEGAEVCASTCVHTVRSHHQIYVGTKVNIAEPRGPPHCTRPPPHHEWNNCRASIAMHTRTYHDVHHRCRDVTTATVAAIARCLQGHVVVRNGQGTRRGQQQGVVSALTCHYTYDDWEGMDPSLADRTRPRPQWPIIIWATISSSKMPTATSELVSLATTLLPASRVTGQHQWELGLQHQETHTTQLIIGITSSVLAVSVTPRATNEPRRPAPTCHSTRTAFCQLQ